MIAGTVARMKNRLSRKLAELEMRRGAPGAGSALAVARQDILERLLLSGALMALIGVILRLISFDPIAMVAYGVASVAFFVLKRQSRWSFKWRASGLLAVFYFLALFNLLRVGLSVSGTFFLILLPPLALLLLGAAPGIGVGVLSMVTWLGAEYAARWVSFPAGLLPPSAGLTWLYTGFDLFWIILILMQILWQFYETQNFLESVGREKQELQATRTELLQRTQQLATVADVGRAVTSSLDLQALLRVLVKLMMEAFGFYGVNVWMLTEPPDAVQLKAGLSPEGEDFSQVETDLEIGRDNSITAVCKSGEYWICNTIQPADDLPLRNRFPEARAQLVLPLKVAHKNVGALEILSKQEDAFTDEDITLLRSLSDQVTIAIRNATLYEEAQARRHFAETLYEIGRVLSSTIQLDEVLEMILQQLNEIVPADRSAVMLRDGEELEFVATRGFPETAQVNHTRLRLLPESIYGQVFTTQRPLALPDVSLNPDWHQAEDLSQARSWMGVPLIRSNQVIGMISLSRQTLLPYSFSEVTLAQTFAGQAAIALENARIYDHLAWFTQQLEEMVQARTEELSRAYTQLEQLDRTKSDFIQVTSHELRTPLTVLAGYGQMLLQNQTITTDPSLSQLVTGIYSGAERLHEIVNSMLDIVKIDSRALELSPVPINIGLLMRNVVGNFKNILRQRSLTMVVSEMGELPPVEADNNALQKVFRQLVSNAIKYTPDGGTITITGRALETMGHSSDPGLEIVVSDTGIGIDPAQQELIFTKFYQTGTVALHSSSHTKFKGGGPGLGLPIARGIVQAHGGRLWVESPGHDETRCPGSHFHLVLPLQQKPVTADAVLENQDLAK
jgi:signal transduction histidine kinase